MEPTDLACLLYVSTATRIFSEADMQEMLREARDRNEDNEITGLLIYGAGHFLQVLEGTHEKVVETYARICADDRHEKVTKMLEEPIDSRFFKDWSMAYRLYPSAQVPENPSLQAILTNEAKGTMEMVRELLRIFQSGLGGGMSEAPA